MPSTEELSAQVAALAAELREMRARLDASERPRGLMRDTRRCPACRGEEILFISEFKPQGQYFPLRVGVTGAFRQRSYGIIQAFVCASCGHTEMQIDDPGALRGFDGVSLLAAAPGEQGPYR